MKAEILSIGSELTSGQNLDTNSQWLSLRLAEIGIPVGWHTTIADDLQANIDAFLIAGQRAQLVIATGGLGPTLDDLTREVLAKIAGVELVFHPESFEQIQAMFAKRKRMMPERNRVQAFFPEGAEPIPNTCGTAPGVYMKSGAAVFVAMPGVPTEMFAMYEQWVKPRLLQLGLSGGVQIQRKINCFGAGESHIEEKLFDLTRRGHVPEVGITASDAVISLRIFARTPTIHDAQAQIAPVEQTIRERLGELVFGVEDEGLQDIVVRLLKKQRLTLAVAEGVTAGVISEQLAKVPGASRVFVGGLVAYDHQLKKQFLGVSEGTLDRHGVVSPQTAEAMAIGCRAMFGTDLAISTVGIAGPDGATEEKPVGTVFAALAWSDGVRSAAHSWTGTRTEVQSRTAKLALNLVRLHLLERA